MFGDDSTDLIPKPVFCVLNIVLLHYVQVVRSVLLHSQQRLLVNYFCHGCKFLKRYLLAPVLWMAVLHSEVAHPTGVFVHKSGPRFQA